MSALVTTNYPIIAAKLKALPAKLRPVVRRSLRKGLELTSGMAQRLYLSGPRPQRLGVVTTRLRNSVAASVGVADDGHTITGRLGSNVRYAAFHEFGFRGVQHVRAHQRLVNPKVTGNGMGLARFRGAIKELNTGKVVGYKRSLVDALRLARGKGAGVSFGRQLVKAHTRNVTYNGRPYIAPSLARNKALIVKLITDDLAKALASSQLA